MIFLLITILAIAVFFLIYKAIILKPDPSANTGGQEVVETEMFYQKNVGLSLPKGYEVVDIDKKNDNLKNEVIMQLKRTDPQSFVIVQRNKGVSTASSLARMNPLEYIESTIRQFYPVRYGASYQSESLERVRLGEKDAVEHIYSYTDKDGKPNKVRLLSIVWSDDETYNIILQSSETNFETIKNDMNYIKSTFKVAE